MADIIKTTVDTKGLTDLEPIVAVKTATKPTLTKAVVEQAIPLLRELMKNGGYGDIAETIGFEKINKAQVKEVHLAMKSKIAELNYVEPVVEEPIEEPITE